VEGAPYYPYRFSGQDGAFLADNGFTAARVGQIWAGVEPQAGKYDDSLLAKESQVNALMGRYGIRTLFDFHQDGPGAFPQWATVGNVTSQDQYQRFWDDAKAPDGVGIQTHFVNMWRHVASVLGGSQNIIGFDPLNEPPPPTSSGCAPLAEPCPLFESGQLATFYRRVIGAIRYSDKRTVIWPEPLASNYITPSALPKFDDSQVGFNVHIYCPTFPTNSGGATCQVPEQHAFSVYYDDYADKLDLPVFVSEFSSTDDEVDNTGMVDALEQRFSTWTSWAYTNSTGGGEEGGQGFVANDNRPGSETNVNQAKADAMVVPYAQAVAGTPISQNLDRATDTYTLAYRASAVPGAHLAAGVPTQVFVPHRKYPQGYRVNVTGASVVSEPGWPWLELKAVRPGATVHVTITPASRGRTLTPLQTGLVPVHQSARCPAASGRLRGSHLGRLFLGMSRRRAQRAYPRFTHRRLSDRVCLSQAALTAGYPSSALLRKRGRRQRQRLRGRVIVLTTANHHYALHGVRAGDRFHRVRRKLGRLMQIRIGHVRWYATRRGRVSGLVQVRGGLVRQIGLVDRRFARTKAALKRLVRAVRL
jgi:endoglycosylceramidase